MRLRILGPLEFARDGAWHRVGAAKCRSLLALLVLNAGWPVSVDRLIEELWPDGSPATAVGLVHSYVARLRRALGDANGELVRTISPGYEFAATPGDLDHVRFEELTSEGGAALRAGDAEAAASLLGKALELWRGPALADVPPTLATRAAAERLAELRLTALENRIDADLACGRHADLIAELRALGESNPFRERLWAQQMLALYRCGRQADALAAYQQLRTTLESELGVAPSGPLLELHQQILQNHRDLDLVAPSSEATADPIVIPRQLPAATRHFVGRERELRELDDLTSDAAPAAVVGAIAGPPGIGKTALAVHWGQRAAERFPDGQLYVDLCGFHSTGRPVTPGEALRKLLDALGVPAARIPTDQAAQAGLYRSVVADRRMLVVLDNARDAEQVRALLPGGHRCVVLVTSRTRLTGLVAGHGAHAITLDLLSDSDSSELLGRYLGRDRVDAEPAAATALIKHCSQLPLALTIAASRAAVEPALSLADIAAELTEEGRRLDALDAGAGSAAVRAVFSWSYQATSTKAQRLFRLMGVAPGRDISSAAAASLVGDSPMQVRRQLDELCRAHLIAEYPRDRFEIHNLLRDYAVELATATEQRDALRRLYNHHVQTATAAARLLNPQRAPEELPRASEGVTPERLGDREQAAAWLETEWAVLSALVTREPDAEWDPHVWLLAWSLVDHFTWRAEWQALIDHQHVALSAAQRVGNESWQATSHRLLARGYIELGDCEKGRANLERMLCLATKIGHLATQARAHRGLGFLLGRLGDAAAAIDHAQEALVLLQSADDAPGEAEALNSLAWHHATLEKFEEALNYCRAALELHQRIGKSHPNAAAWDTLGYIHHQLGDHQEAIACYRRCHELYRELGGDRFYEADTLTHLGDAYQAAGDLDTAQHTWQQALHILEELEHPDTYPVRDRLRDTGEHVPTAG